jgi:hypothetical protein
MYLASSSRWAPVPQGSRVHSPTQIMNLGSLKASALGSSRVTANLVTNAPSHISCPARAWPWTGKTRRPRSWPQTRMDRPKRVERVENPLNLGRKPVQGVQFLDPVAVQRATLFSRAQPPPRGSSKVQHVRLCRSLSRQRCPHPLLRPPSRIPTLHHMDCPMRTTSSLQLPHRINPSRPRPRKIALF